jgi:hypothetical protein
MDFSDGLGGGKLVNNEYFYKFYLSHSGCLCSFSYANIQPGKAVRKHTALPG